MVDDRFNSNYKNIHPSELSAVFAIDFSSNPALYSSFAKYAADNPNCILDSTHYSAVIGF